MMMEDQLPLLAMPTGKSLLDMNEEERESWRANAQKNLDNARSSESRSSRSSSPSRYSRSQPRSALDIVTRSSRRSGRYNPRHRMPDESYSEYLQRKQQKQLQKQNEEISRNQRLMLMAQQLPDGPANTPKGGAWTYALIRDRNPRCCGLFGSSNEVIARTLVYAVNGQRFRESGLPYVEEE